MFPINFILCSLKYEQWVTILTDSLSGRIKTVLMLEVFNQQLVRPSQVKWELRDTRGFTLQRAEPPGGVGNADLDV